MPGGASESSASTGSDDRSDTAVEKPLSARLSARFFPMTPSPYTPICAVIDRPPGFVGIGRLRASGTPHLARGRVGRHEACGEPPRGGVVLVDQGLKLLAR